MPHLNLCIIAGHLGRDAETQYIGNGIPKTSFSVAVSERWKDKSGEQKEKTVWLNVVVWNRENLAQYLTKGKAVMVRGKIDVRQYEDKDGNKRTAVEIIADEVQFLGGGEKRDDQPVSAPRSARARQQPAPPVSHQYEQQTISDDDVPF